MSERHLEHDFFGVTMYWSHYETRWYCERLERAGFEILQLGDLGHGYGEVPGRSQEHHPLVLARLREPGAGCCAAGRTQLASTPGGATMDRSLTRLADDFG